MKSYLECIPCFLNQTIRIMNLTKINSKTKEKIFKKIMDNLKKFNMNASPAEFALSMYELIEDNIDMRNFYKKIKYADNYSASSSLNKVNNIIKKSKDPLETLVKISISGNIMDFAANPTYNVVNKIKESLSSKFAVNDYLQLKKQIHNSKSIIYIVDNAGEIIFDKLLIEKLSEISNAQLTVFVRSKPVLNDVTEEDARLIGLDKIPNVKIKKIKTIFPFVHKPNSIENDLKKADLIISKGQANYECLSESKYNIYFLLVAKCDVIARNIGVKKHSFVLMKNKHFKSK